MAVTITMSTPRTRISHSPFPRLHKRKSGIKKGKYFKASYLKAACGLYGRKSGIKKGKYLKVAYLSLAYGASIRTACKNSGLSRRRVKVLMKNLNKIKES